MNVLAVEQNEIALLDDFEFAVAAALASAFNYIHNLGLAVPLKLGFAGI